MRDNYLIMLINHATAAGHPRHGVSPPPGRTAGSRSPVFSGRIALGLCFAVCLVAGCSTAPSWVTAEECDWSPDATNNPCALIPSWQIARDFQALASDAVAGDAQLADSASLRRLSPAAPRPAYRLGPDDELSIAVWGSKEIWSEITDQSLQPTRVTSVQEDGTIVLPLLVPVDVGGLTLSEALAKISDSYRRILGSTFQVNGQITKFRSKPVQLDGAITRPGTVYLSPEVRTLSEAVSIGGGGLPESAALAKVLLIRGQQRYRIDYAGAQSGANDQYNIELQRGDRIYFPSRETGFYYVLGEVLVPGQFPLPPKGITLMQGISLARGPINFSGNMESIFLVRVNEAVPKIYSLKLADIMASRDVPIVPGDRIFVSTTGLAQWDRFWRQILPLFGSAPYILREGYGVDF